MIKYGTKPQGMHVYVKDSQRTAPPGIVMVHDGNNHLYRLVYSVRISHMAKGLNLIF